jgi:hypothetical protein
MLFGGGKVSGKYRDDSTYEPVYSGPDTSCKSSDDVDRKW